jgi:hypothetical protein
MKKRLDTLTISTPSSVWFLSWLHYYFYCVCNKQLRFNLALLFPLKSRWDITSQGIRLNSSPSVTLSCPPFRRPEFGYSLSDGVDEGEGTAYIFILLYLTMMSVTKTIELGRWWKTDFKRTWTVRFILWHIGLLLRNVCASVDTKWLNNFFSAWFSSELYK